MHKMPRDTALAVLNILKAELPQCFKHGGDKHPLAIGIYHQVSTYFGNHLTFSKTNLRQAIHFYTHSKQYLRNVIEGAARIDIYGNAVGTVTAQDVAYAKNVLEKRKAISAVTIKRSASPSKTVTPSKASKKYFVPVAKHSVFAYKKNIYFQTKSYEFSKMNLILKQT